MLVAHIWKLQENTAALCKMAAKLSGRAISRSGYVWPWKSKYLLSHPASGAGCEISGWNVSGAEFRMWDIQVECRRSRIPDVRHPGGMSAEQNFGCETSGSLAKVRKPCYVIPTACHSPRFAALRWCIRTPILLAFQIYLWKRTSKLRFFMFLSFPLFCHGFQRALLNLGLLWW